MSWLCIAHKRYCEGFRGGSAIFFYPSEWTPSSFAWRNNDGVKPEYKGLIEILTKIDVYNGDTDSSIKYASDVDWRPHCCSHQVAKWRPVVLQSESPTVSPKEDKPIRPSGEASKLMEDFHNGNLDMKISDGKPVYTAEMHAKCELPQIGSDFNIEGWNSRQCTMTAIGRDNILFICDKFEYVREIKNIAIKPIITTIKVNGFDVPAPMSEAPEDGADCFVVALTHKDFFYSIKYGNGSCGDCVLHRGLIHSTESAAIAHAKAMLGIDPNA